MERTIDQVMGGQVRSRILAEHAVIRTALDEMDALLDAFQRGGPDLGRRLRLHGAEFFDAFSSHLDVEDVVLVAALRTLSDGEPMARRLAKEHREQRRIIAALLDQIRDDANPTTQVASELRTFINSVRIDMEHEEVTILREGLLAES